MGRTIRELEADNYVLAEISHVTDDEVGIVGRSGKLHVPDCPVAGRTVTVRIDTVEEGYVVGVPDQPPSDADEPLYVQRSSDTDDPESDQLDKLSYEEWRRRRFAARFRDRLPDPLTDRVPAGSLSVTRLRSAATTIATVVAALTVVALLGLAVTRGVAVAGRYPALTVAVIVLGVVGLLNTYAGHAMWEVYLRFAGALTGMGIGVSIGVAMAPAYVAVGAGMEGPALGRLLVGLLLGLLVVSLLAGLGGGIGWVVAPVLHRLLVMAGGFTALAYPTFVLVAGVSVGAVPSAASLFATPLALVLATAAGLVGAVVALFVHVASVILVTSGVGALVLTLDVALVGLLASAGPQGSILAALGVDGGGPILPSLVEALLASTGLLVAFLFFFLSGVLVQGWLLRLELAEDTEPTSPWNEPTSRDGWEPPNI